jgi:hypothetical protein
VWVGRPGTHPLWGKGLHASELFTARFEQLFSILPFEKAEPAGEAIGHAGRFHGVGHKG